MKRNPLIAALLNILFWGLGYLYNGKRIAFGVLLLIASFSLTFLLLLPSTTETTTTANPLADLYSLGIYLIPIAFAYDAYKEAEELNKRKKSN